MNLRFDEPGWSWVLLLLVVPLASWWTIERITPARRVAAILLRSLAVACVAAALARPWLLTTQASIAVVGVIDVSGSTTRFSSTPPEELASAFLRAAQPRRPDDRVGLVAFDGTARAVVMPTTGRVEPDPPRLVDDSGSALADAVTLARALVPADEAGRIVVFSDGLETIGRAERIAEIDADRVSIDTVLVPLEPLDDVAIESFDLPASALPHSRVGAIVSLRSSGDASGTLRIRMDGRSLSLQGDGASGEGLPVRLKTGSTRVRVSIPIGDGPVHELEASFEPDDPAADRLVENSAAKRAIAVPAGRSVLVLDRSGAASDLDASLRAAGFEVRRRPADSLPEDPLWLAGFDLIVLDGVPAAQMSRSAQRLVADQVQHLGAGVIALGGEASFGAGGWRGSTLAELLPVEVEPPTEDRRPRAALVFVIDRSGSMRQAVAGTRSTQQEIANEAASLATESIASRAHVGVIAFDSSPSVIVPTRPMDDSSLVVKRIRGIHSDGGTAIGAALALALDELEPIPEVDRKLVVLLTDGRGRDDALLLEQADRAANAGVTVTTISIGDSADDSLLGAVAERTGGVFHPVRNPRVLPRVLVESVQSINRPLIREGTIDVLPQGDSAPARALDRAPPLAGLCILGRPRSAETVIDAVSDENEPLLARWPAGIGRAAIFASSPDEPWSGGWSEWSGRSEFWESLARWAARAPGSAPVAAEARIEEGRFIVTIDAAAADAIEGAAVEALVRRPDGGRDSFELRRVAPRRFVGAVEADAPGAWLAVLSPRGPAGPLPPMLAAAVAPEGVEYSRQREDPAPLESLRRAGGGRELPLDRLESFDLHSRDGLRLGVRERALAPWLLVAAALCFVADAAVRRLAVRRSQVAEALRVTSA
ncbi:MAG: VWA domain-containing protein, partial [Phycisphaerae bacterium]|nr:VWA domain-containing protein [Phycisphaerae bacterium]